MRSKYGPFMRNQRRKWKKIAGGLLVVASATIGLLGWLLFPPQNIPFPTDTVMVIAGASDGRHQLGAQVINAGYSQNFVVSNPLGVKDKIGSAHCRGQKKPAGAVQTWCLRPDPVTTTGEALTMDTLAVQEGWETATVVTSRTHARRVHTMFKYCSDLKVNLIYVERLQKDRVKQQVLHEIGGYIKFWLTRPC